MSALPVNLATVFMNIYSTTYSTQCLHGGSKWVLTVSRVGRF